MKPKYAEARKETKPVVILPLQFKQRGKGYLQFAAILLISGGTIGYILFHEGGSGDWLSPGTLVIAFLFALPGILFGLVGLHYYTRRSEIIVFRDRVAMATKTAFMRRPRLTVHPMKEFTGVAAACERGRNVTLNYVMLSHPVASRSVVVARGFPDFESAKKRRNELARVLKLPVIQSAGEADRDD